MTQIDEMKDKGAMVIVGDDVNKASWRFEREGIGMPLEESAAWGILALRNNILDPLQTAQSDNPNAQWVKPRKEISLIIKNANKDKLIVPRKSVLVISSFYYDNNVAYSDGASIFTDSDIIIERDYSTIKIQYINDIYIEITTQLKETAPVMSQIKVDRFPYSPRQMQINGMANAPKAGKVLTTGSLGWSLQ